MSFESGFGTGQGRIKSVGLGILRQLQLFTHSTNRRRDWPSGPAGERATPAGGQILNGGDIDGLTQGLPGDSPNEEEEEEEERPGLARAVHGSRGAHGPGQSRKSSKEAQ